ncbi:MAG: LytTR family DNA-binding domain-containing protein [Microscillaceae bacterium]|nr:LytTR family DNA-binding domain-containing protein [Microscillaceae bacterium]
MKQELEKAINCMVVDDDKVSRSIIGHFINKTDYLHLSHTCESAIDAHNILLKDHEIDILFLDIEMPEMTGMELLQTLKNTHLNIVFTTSREKYAVKAFEYNVQDYLVKPINYSRFLQATQKVLERIDSGNQVHENTPGFLFVRANHKIVKIDPKDIYYIEALSDYILIHTISQKFVVHSTMKGIEKKLESFKDFLRVHRSFIINVLHIDSVQDVNVSIHGKSIPIGRSYKNQFIDKLNVL